ncbi:MAG: transposase [Desulfobacteraceae bacterium]|nr:MAG: transposase [Desulfobacteraceae bacterium]
MSTLCEWNQVFDGKMIPVVVPDKRGKGSRITAGMVREIVKAAKDIKAKGQRLRLKAFVKKLSEEHDIVLTRKKVTEVLIANGLYKASIRRRRPGFYQRLRQTIPNGLISVDGSEFKVLIDGIVYKFNLELGVDVESFCHTAFSVSDSETTEEFIKVMEEHKALWGSPIGLVYDHGSANLSGESIRYLDRNDIKVMPAGPGNPKGNGTCEGAFSEMKEVIGTVHLETSSPREMARMILEKIVSVYVKMRNRVPRFGEGIAPSESMASPVLNKERENIKERYRKRIQKTQDPSQRAKLDRLDFIIRNHRLETDEKSLKRGQKCIVSYDLEAISKSEEAFLKAIRRNQQRATLPYFFGILKNIQNEMDEARNEDYCRRRYGYEQVLEREREKQEQMDNEPTVEGLAGMIKNAVLSRLPSLKDILVKQAKRMAGSLRKQYCYLEVLRKKVLDALNEVSEFTLEQLKKATILMEEVLA